MSETSRHDFQPTEIAGVQRQAGEFAAGYADLSLYRRLAEGLASDDDVAALLLAAGPGQARPVLMLAALHDLVLRRPNLPAAQWYPSVTGAATAPDGDPWPDIRAAALEHADELREVIANRTTQTNEVNRAVYVATLLSAACADLPDAPVTLVEQGASAGLLLGIDRYRTSLSGSAGTRVVGDLESAVRCEGEDRSATPWQLRMPSIASRIGLDRHPADLQDPTTVRWLEACLWPDLPVRLHRFRTAVETVRNDPPRVVVGDMVSDLQRVIGEARTRAADEHVVIFSSWALTYVASELRPHVTNTLAQLASDGMPVSWVTAEPDGCVPGVPATGSSDTVLGIQRWRGGRPVQSEVIGTCHPHGTWVHATTPI